MASGWFQSAFLLCSGAVALACQSPAAPHHPAKPAMPSSASSPSAKTFEEDVAFLSQHAPVKVLSSASGGGRAVSGQYQGRVMTSAVGAGKPSLGFINRNFIEAG